MKWFVIIAVLMCPGCKLAGMSDEMPSQFTLSLHTSKVNMQTTYFKLDANGTLHFAGGRDALTRATRPLMTLTAGQRHELWDLIVKYNLHNASGELFPSRQHVLYEFTLGTGTLSPSRHLSAADDAVPGLAQLHAHLLKLRSLVALDSPLPGPD